MAVLQPVYSAASVFWLPVFTEKKRIGVYWSFMMEGDEKGVFPLKEGRPKAPQKRESASKFDLCAVEVDDPFKETPNTSERLFERMR
jgi:hypothetical protein